MKETNIEALLAKGDFLCECGRMHAAKLKKAVIRSGAIAELPGILRGFGAEKAFVLADENTFAAAGEKVVSVLDGASVAYRSFIMGKERIEPGEHAVGSALLHFDPTCDVLVSVGSGVINDIGKIIANTANIPYVIVGTAPSMDGYASATSSVIRDDLKVSVDSKCPEVVIGDLDVLCESPVHMILSGIGDMLAKYISICEWRISNVINGEYYCERIAGLINTALKKCVDNAEGVLTKDPEAVKAVMEGMVLSGIAANYAGVSRPVSGMEHYFSHVWDMRAIEFKTPSDLHGIQCGIGTVDSLRVYEKIRTLVPDKQKAINYVASFDYDKWKEFLVKNLGKGADAMIINEAKERKYDREKHAARIDLIIGHWDEIIRIIDGLPSSEQTASLLRRLGAPVTASDIGVSAEEEHNAFLMTKDIRDKYIGSRLLWDLGMLDEVADELFPF